MQTASLTVAIVGTVELVKRLFSKDFQAVAIIVGSALVGALLAPQVSITWFQGLLLGLGGSGLVTTAGYFSSK